MSESDTVKKGLKKIDWMIGLGLGAVALLFYGLSCAGYVFPGLSAKLMAVWQGLDTNTFNQYPFFSAFAKMLGSGNLIAPICGAVSVSLVYAVFTALVGARVNEENVTEHSTLSCRIGGIIAALAFMMAPAVISAATHVEPRLFDVTVALAAFALLVCYAKAPRSLGWLCITVAAILAGCGLADTPMFLVLLPLYIIAVWFIARRLRRSPYGPAAGFLLLYIIVFFTYTPLTAGNFGELMTAHKDMLKSYCGAVPWLAVWLTAFLPFVLALLAGKSSFSRESDFPQIVFHGTMTLVSLFALATPLSPSSQMMPYGVLPVAACTCAAITAGCLTTYWVFRLVPDAGKIPRVAAMVLGGLFAIVVSITWIIELFSFDSKDGKFADIVADRIVKDLGEREWIVTDGTLDEHIRFAAKRAGREIGLICLARDSDKTYIKGLEERILNGGLRVANTNELTTSLMLGILPFVQDWFATDPEIASKVAIYGAPDIWYSADISPVPELFLFGGDPSKLGDFSGWREFSEVLSAPPGWGSYRLWQEKNPLVRARLELRRHLGFVANNSGVAMMGVFDKLSEERMNAAFERFELVLNEIDSDNICALLNEIELAGLKCRKAMEKQRELDRKYSLIVEDKERRYRLSSLGNYYGYIRNPEIFIKLGIEWARYGSPGEALHRFRHAFEFVPETDRNMLMNMMASLYASGHDTVKSREVYEKLLADESQNRAALIGLARLELLDGNKEKAMEYFERALADIGDDPRVYCELATLSLMRGELDEAKAILRKATDANHSDLRAWSLIAAVTIQQIDATKDEAVKAKLMDELENVILATMEKQPRGEGDYYINSTRAFILLRKGAEHRKEARDAFAAAAKSRPDIEAINDQALGLDISLNDTADAERRAREMLRRNRKAPLANYVMGSLALQRGAYAEAEAFLRRACDTSRPVPLALNDLAEVLRRNRDFAGAEKYARKATETAPDLYVVWETLGSVLLDSEGNLDEAEQCIRKACDMSKEADGREADVRMLVSLARVQLARKDMVHAKMTIGKVNRRIKELSDYERADFEELKKSAR